MQERSWNASGCQTSYLHTGRLVGVTFRSLSGRLWDEYRDDDDHSDGHFGLIGLWIRSFHCALLFAELGSVCRSEEHIEN